AGGADHGRRHHLAFAATRLCRTGKPRHDEFAVRRARRALQLRRTRNPGLDTATGSATRERLLAATCTALCTTRTGTDAAPLFPGRQLQVSTSTTVESIMNKTSHINPIGGHIP